MKILCLFLGTVVVIVCSTSSSSADVYNCDGVWATKPCEGGAVELPPISWVPGSQVQPAAASKPESASPVAENPRQQSTSAADSSCAPDPTGYDLKIADLHAHTTKGAVDDTTQVRGTLLNASGRDFAGAVFVEVRAGSERKLVARQKLSDYLAANANQRFTVDAHSTDKGRVHSANFYVKLSHPQPYRCYNYSVSTTSAAIVDASVGEQSGIRARISGQYEKQVLDSLAEIRTQARAVARAYPPPARRNNTKFEREVHQLQIRVATTCSRTEFHASSRLDSACFKAANAVQKLR